MGRWAISPEAIGLGNGVTEMLGPRDLDHSASPASLERRPRDRIEANDDVWTEALRESLTGGCLRCLAYALPLGLLSWAVIIFGIAVIAGRLHAL